MSKARTNSKNLLNLAPVTSELISLAGEIAIDASGSMSFATNAYTTPVALVDAATIAVNAALSNNFTVTLAGNRTMDAPTNAVAGMVINIAIKQDATGSRTLAWNTVWDFGASGTPVLSTGAGKTDFISTYYDSGAAKWLASFRKSA